MFIVYVNYGKRKYLCQSNCSTDFGHNSPVQYGIMQDNMVFIAIDFLVPNSAYINSELKHTARP